MKLYTSDGCAYEGMTQETVTTLRAALGRSTTFVSEQEFLSWLAAHQE
jgi:hypothetical protein